MPQIVDRFGLVNWVNVIEHGAWGNGVHDDTTAFVNAITHAGNNILYVPKGSYVITADVTAGATITIFFSAGVTLNIAETFTFTISGKLVTPYLPTITGLGTFTYAAAERPANVAGNLVIAGNSVSINGSVSLNQPTDMTGTLIVGNGGASLAHTAGSEGYYNTIVGYLAGNAITTGYTNASLGHAAMYTTTTGYDNVAIGHASLYANITGNKNTAVGKNSLLATTGSGNVGVGHFAGRYETGSNSFYVDNQDRTNTAGDKAKALLYGIFAALAADQTLTVNGILTALGLKLKDTGADHTLTIKPNENLTADKIFNLVTGDADRTLTLSGNPTLADWFDQAVKVASSPTFANLQLTGHVYFDAEVDNGDSSTADIIDWTTGNKQKSTLTVTPCVYTFTPPTGICSLTLRLIQGGIGSYLVTWPATVKWVGGVPPTLSTAVGAVDIISFYWDGTYYYGSALIGFAVPA